MARSGATVALTLVLALVVQGMARADAAGDERYLRIEDAERFYAQMAEFALMQGPLVEVMDRRELPALVQRGTALAAGTFAVHRAGGEMRERLAEVAGKVPEAFEAISDRMRAAEEELSSRSTEELRRGQAEALARYEARRDRSSIDAISNAMAAPELARETAITGLRVKWIYETVLTGDMEKLRTTTPDRIEAGIQEVLDRTRTPDDPEYGAPPFRKDFVREQARVFRRMVLSHLPEADISTLTAFYASETGRAKRDAVIDAFRERNDDDGRHFIRQLLEQEQRKAQ